MNEVLEKKSEVVDFLSLELTNQCNLQCIHCYANAGPQNMIYNLLKINDYKKLIQEGIRLGSRAVQFIGGEPTLNKDLPYLIAYAHETGYEHIEVFSNLTVLNPELIDCFLKYNVHVATSVYAPTELIHDKITKNDGSFSKTVNNISLLLDKHIELRVGIIEMEENCNYIEKTRIMLSEMGVKNIGGDKVRQTGRGEALEGEELTELCGGCNGKTIHVGSDGVVTPCILSKNMSVGSISNSSLLNIINSDDLARLKNNLHKKIDIQAICTPKVCSPYDSCSPKHGPGPCAPSGCTPCYPKG